MRCRSPLPAFARAGLFCLLAPPTSGGGGASAGGLAAASAAAAALALPLQGGECAGAWREEGHEAFDTLHPGEACSLLQLRVGLVGGARRFEAAAVADAGSASSSRHAPSVRVADAEAGFVAESVAAADLGGVPGCLEVFDRLSYFSSAALLETCLRSGSIPAGSCVEARVALGRSRPWTAEAQEDACRVLMKVAAPSSALAPSGPESSLDWLSALLRRQEPRLSLAETTKLDTAVLQKAGGRGKHPVPPVYEVNCGNMTRQSSADGEKDILVPIPGTDIPDECWFWEDAYPTTTTTTTTVTTTTTTVTTTTTTTITTNTVVNSNYTHGTNVTSADASQAQAVTTEASTEATTTLVASAQATTVVAAVTTTVAATTAASTATTVTTVAATTAPSAVVTTTVAATTAVSTATTVTTVAPTAAPATTAVATVTTTVAAETTGGATTTTA
mmetsp:Transcript_11021/g.38845  ORF Transcript_11021/g.38845 Transcript_11021/m.38845 type:complete len:447 (-) Transcript_11021:308-1648(-)|eukprot:CAMPEP_0203926034 /NCGR_PEP_ID=MMETSP0359-20131031/65589_1 /ASSEMBLY_ACC=CAM_ASM_000338 /TAXON_ID=268821 /ORGANISM="Scrippsiella Hangoei, Strain SHTV-5" /LENGTH=446 /DNA_ID=CAMNT_0050854563 /DNA_START=113 /DNA_END=1453 /DNA_ORIENTATION=-